MCPKTNIIEIMIRKNTSLAGIKNTIEIGLGNGDVSITATRCQVDKYTGIAFKNCNPVQIGKIDGSTAGGTLDELDPDAVITFTDVKSIEILERALNKAKMINKHQQRETNWQFHVCQTDSDVLVTSYCKGLR